jgi:hypothetical protein
MRVCMRVTEVGGRIPPAMCIYIIGTIRNTPTEVETKKRDAKSLEGHNTYLSVTIA